MSPVPDPRTVGASAEQTTTREPHGASKLTTDISPYPDRDPVLEEETLDEWRWALQERSKGRFDEYAGRHVAVVNRTVLGSSSDPNLLEKYLAEKYQINPRRIVIFFVEGA